MNISNWKIADNHPTFVIAEAGVNHNGNIELAKQLVDVAVEAKVDSIKFQMFNPKLLAAVSAPKAEYQKSTTSAQESHIAMLEKLALTFDEFVELKKYCDQKHILFLASPFDLESLDQLLSLQVAAIKIPSGEITNDWLLEAIAAAKLPVIMSTGMANIAEIHHAVQFFEHDNLSLLHCISSYPTPYEQVNLNAMTTLKNTFNVPIGFSDHTPGIEIPLAAVALGAKIIEKHFTLDKTMEGPDHRASIDPTELQMMMQGIRHIEKARGSTLKEIQPCEINSRDVARKSLVYKQSYSTGTIVQKDMLALKRPGTGIPVRDLQVVEGRTLTCDVYADELVTISHFK